MSDVAWATSDEDNVFIYDTVTGTPCVTEAFASTEHADDFVRWLGDDPRRLGPREAQAAQKKWHDERVDPLTGELREAGDA